MALESLWRVSVFQSSPFTDHEHRSPRDSATVAPKSHIASTRLRGITFFIQFVMTARKELKTLFTAGQWAQLYFWFFGKLIFGFTNSTNCSTASSIEQNTETLQTFDVWLLSLLIVALLLLMYCTSVDSRFRDWIDNHKLGGKLQFSHGPTSLHNRGFWIRLDFFCETVKKWQTRKTMIDKKNQKSRQNPKSSILQIHY